MTDALFQRAQQAQLAGRPDEAEQLYQEALALDPHNAHVIHGLGNLLQQRGAVDEAIEHYRRALRLAPDFALAYYNLGYALEQSGRLEEAVQAYRDALARRPDIALAHFRLGSVLHTLGQVAEAGACYQRAIALKPDLARAHYQLGNLLQQTRQLERSADCYRRALDLDPDFGSAHYRLAITRRFQGRLDDAVPSLRAALRCLPERAEIHAELGNVLALLLEVAEARSSFEAALRLKPDNGHARLGLCISQLPAIHASEAGIMERRQAYQHSLEELARHYAAAPAAECAAAADAVGALQPFYLPYQGLDDRRLQSIYGELICRLMAARYPQWTQPRPAARSEGRKLRVGIVSGYFWGHSNWKIPIRGWVQHIDRTRFELFGYHTTEVSDRHTDLAATCFTSFTRGPLSLQQWCELILEHRIDVLIFPEIGMDSMTVRLGCLRLAPVQVVSWGHPVTSGMPTMDYYVTGALMEPRDGRAHYTETLVPLPNLSICYARPDIAVASTSRADLGIAPGEIFFWCCQSLYKYLPQHDDVFVRIAQRLPRSRFVFIDQKATITATFRHRLKGLFDAAGLDFERHCVFLPRLYVEVFAAAACHADVFLDSIGWSGCNSTLESLARDCPVVTLPGELMRGRHSAAALARMEIGELIARDKDAYVELAIRLGQDEDYRRSLRQRIGTHKALLYDDLEPIRALERFLLDATEKARP